MIRWCVAGAVLVLIPSAASADPALRWLVEHPDGSVSGLSAKLDGELSKELAFAEGWTHHPGDRDPRAGCKRALLTNLVVSYNCSRVRDKYDSANGATYHVTYAVANDKLVPVSFDDVIQWYPDPTGTWDHLKGTNPFAGNAPCTPPGQHGAMVVTRKGLEVFLNEHNYEGCYFTWKDLKPLLKPGTPIASVVAALLAGTLTGGPGTDDLAPVPVPPPGTPPPGTPAPAIRMLWVPGGEMPDPAKIHMIGATQMLTAAIGQRFGTELHLFGTVQAEPTTPVDTDENLDHGHCEVGYATSVLVSWMCRERLDKYTWGRTVGDYLIEGDTLKPLTADDIFAPRKDLAAQLDQIHADADTNFYKCIDPRYGWHVEPGGLRGFSGTSGEGCVVPWAMVRSLLKPGSAVERLARSWYVDGIPDPPRETTKDWGADPRWVSDGDAVRDRFTGLVWAAHDNGADLDADAAAAYAKAYRGGSHDDWRLPTEEELEMIAEPVLAHRVPKDCTGGKSSYAITPLIHVSCGLAWSSTVARGRSVPSAVGMGFISGTARASARTEKKNYRALVVRKG